MQVTEKQGGTYVNGAWRNIGSRQEVKNPATGEVIDHISFVPKETVQEAIDGAHDAFQNWSKTTSSERAKRLRTWYQLIMQHRREIAEQITLEMGKPFKEAKGEVIYGASFIEWYAEEAKRIYGETIPASHPDKRLMVLKQPVGVVAAITPWNFPAAMITRKIAPALAAGCTVVIKPSEETPLTAIKLVELAHEAGFPPGVIQLVQSEPAAFSEVCMQDQRVRKITFTGSTEVGRHLMRQSADQVKKVSLELGGHAPIIVLDDADIDKAVQGVIASKYRNAGQTCVCGNRIYVQEGIYDAFVARFVEQVQTLKVGDGMDENTDLGPLINVQAYEKVERHVQDALNKGANLVCGGQGVQEKGVYFYEPTVLTDVTADMQVMQEETFGPVAPVQKIKSEEEAIQRANQTNYGLAAYFFTESMSKGTRLMEALEYGIVGWNDGVPAVAQAPFGGWKESGLEREGGHQGLESFLETKYVSVQL
ncbi:NAD-dependent succinate-semialdehyde dehydrogenase [Caldalkalibacillus salinus]|uniref:NAD-dependent succinate-semialdehyde dehydrogenase n=1 Tax=Caldalkalibacillus salinus TaxID=2803787 RepID=UPI0019229120|nr:NAD-dependent succinate-semialdehyde dehydrogenase [Caldalkalibacillus salinus]